MFASVKAIRFVVMLVIMWSGFTTTTLYLWKSAGKEYKPDNVSHTGARAYGVTTTKSPTKANSLKLDDIFISVKTSGKFHETRLQVVLKTWWKDCRNQDQFDDFVVEVYDGRRSLTTFFTDSTDSALINITGGRVVNTKCGDSHTRAHLCCKMGYEYDGFIDSGKNHYNASEDYYLGRPSLKFPMKTSYIGERVSFWFATGGAGVCISRSLGEKMLRWSRHGQFRKTCNALKLPDDCTLGFIINNQLNVNLTIRKEFNSHLQMLKKIPSKTFASQVTLSHSADQGYLNVINIEENAAYAVSKDPTRFLSLHCLLQPGTDWCPNSTGNDPQYIL